LVAGNLLGLGLNETTVADGTDQTIDNQGWISRQTGTPLSLNGFPPVSVSGRTYLFAGDEIGLNPLETPATVSQEIDLAPLADAIDRGNIALRWGGYFRTNTAEGGLVTMSLQLLDARGDVWAAIPGRTVFESEWMYLENLTMVPPAIKSARILLTAEIPVFGGFLGVEGLEVQDDAVFADELFVRPELVQIPPQN